MTNNYKTPLECLYHWEKTASNHVYLKQPRNRQWYEYTWKEVGQQARRMASALADLGLERGDKVAIISKNCAEWIISDLAIMMGGYVSVPLYPLQSDDSMRYVLEHSGSKVIFVGKLDNPKQVQSILPNNITKIGYNYDGIHTELKWNDLIKEYDPIAKDHYPAMDDIFTIVYTSGTTGNPKGVVHTYKSASFSGSNGVKTFNVNQQDSYLSFLPLAHVAERILVELSSLYSGAEVSFAESLDTFAEDLQIVSPTRFFSVPRLWSKFQMGVLEKLPQKKLDKLLRIPLLNRVVKKKIRKGLGLDNSTMVIAGAAPMPIPVLKWFAKLDIHIQEGYGMSENFAYGCINRKESIRMGTVGTQMPGGEVKISEEGEILFKSDALMEGYYLEDEKTAEVIKGGYYYTGDAGFIDDEGFVKVTGRIKDNFKTSKGEFVEPAKIEGLLAENTDVEQICVVGLGMVQPICLAVLSEAAREKSKDVVHEDLKKTLSTVNSALQSHEVLNGLIVVKDDWTPENGFMTPTLKIKRHEVSTRYKDLVEQHAECKEVVWE